MAEKDGEQTVREITSKGGQARADKLSPRRRSAIAKQAAAARNEALTPKQRSKLAQLAARERWRKVKEQKEEEKKGQ